MTDINPQVKKAVLNYFALKYKNGDGWFQGIDKDIAISGIRSSCQSAGYGWEVVPGLVTIHCDGFSVWFDRHNKETGTVMTNNTKNPWREMDKDRTVKNYELFADRLDALNNTP